MHRDAVVGNARQFVQGSRGGAMHVSVVTCAQKADNGRDDALLAERHAIVAVPTAHRDRLGHVMTHQRVRLPATTLLTVTQVQRRN